MLSGGIKIPDGADLNNYTTPGNYYCPKDVSIPTLKNCPLNHAFILKVRLSTGEAYPSQEIIEFNTGKKAYRVLYLDNVWQDWIFYVTNTDFDSVGLPKPKSVTDLYGILNSGFFSYNKDANGNPVPDRGGLGICLYESTAWVVLIVIPYNNTTIYIASKISSAWSNWYKLNPVSTTQ